MPNKVNQEEQSLIRREIKYRVEQEYEKYHNEHIFKWNGNDFWIEQIVWKLGETLEDYLNSQVLEAIEKIKSKCGWIDEDRIFEPDTNVSETLTYYVPLSAIESIESEYKNV